jgi:Spy/CpxP family protein refolding chaperone
MLPRRLAAIAAITLALGGAIAIAAPRTTFSSLFAQVPSEQQQHRRQEGWLKDLNLTPEQTQKIQAIRSRYKNQLDQQRQAAQQAQRELRDMMVGTASSDQIRQKYEQVENFRSQLMKTRFNSLLEIRDILTPEQRQKFVQHLNRPRGNLRERMKNRMGEQIQDRQLHHLGFQSL